MLPTTAFQNTTINFHNTPVATTLDWSNEFSEQDSNTLTQHLKKITDFVFCVLVWLTCFAAFSSASSFNQAVSSWNTTLSTSDQRVMKGARKKKKNPLNDEDDDED